METETGSELREAEPRSSLTCRQPVLWTCRLPAQTARRGPSCTEGPAMHLTKVSYFASGFTRWSPQIQAHRDPQNEIWKQGLCG